jgi:hypothetical protein
MKDRIFLEQTIKSKWLLALTGLFDNHGQLILIFEIKNRTNLVFATNEFRYAALSGRAYFFMVANGSHLLCGYHWLRILCPFRAALEYYYRMKYIFPRKVRYFLKQNY